MAQTYTRQSSIADGDTITAALFNNEYNQLLNAFSYSSSSASSTGHRHDGTAGQGGNIHTIGDLDFLNKIVVDSTNNRWGVFVEVSSAAVEQIRIQDGAIVPVTDNDIDLGTSSLEFKDAYFDGTVTTDALVADTADINGGTVDGATIGANSATTIVGTTITANTAFVPDASDGAALGTNALEFSDLYLADGAVVYFGDDQDVSLTHVADTGLLLNSTMALQFNDASQYINAPSATVLDINATDEIELNATLVDINANVEVSGTLTVAGAVDFGDAALSNVGAVQLDSIAGDGDTNTSITFSGSDVITIAAGGDNQVTFTNGAIVPSTDNDIDLGTSSTEFKDAYFDGTVTTDALVADTADINGGTVDGAIIGGASAAAITGTAITGTSFVIGSADINEAELETIDGVTAGTVAASKAVVVDSNKDIGSFRNITLTGELDAATLDISGDADIDGTLEADAITVNGTALASVIAGTTVANATLAATTTVTDSTANTNFPVVFHDESNALLDDTGALRYNPSTGQLLVPNLTVAGTTTTVDTVTMEASNAIIFEGATADAHETTLTVVDPTGDRTIGLPNVSGTLPVLAAASTTQISSTPEELNILDGATVVVGEINALDLGSTAVGTAIASKAVILDSNKDYTGIRNLTITGELDGATLDISGNADIDGTTNLDAVDIDGAVQIDGATTFGVDDTGVDVKFFGATSGAYLLWDESADKLLTAGGAVVDIVKDKLLIGGTAVTTTAAELNVLDAVTAGTVTASLGVVVDSNKDIGSFRNITLTGELDAGSLDVSGDADIDGTLETDALTINGSALNYKAFGTSSIMLGDNATGTIDAADNNTGLGVDVFAALTSGDNNTAVGFAALDANTTASSNTAFGASALGANTTGGNNVAVGVDALKVNTGSFSNVAIGTRALDAFNVTTATSTYNVAVGEDALGATTTGTENTAVGGEALILNTTGNANTGIGRDALASNTTASNNTAVGYDSLKTNTTGANNQGFGTYALTLNTTGSSNTAVGYNALGANTTAPNNTAMGFRCLQANTTGDTNVAIGKESMKVNTTGTNNTAIGARSLDANTTGASNVAVGDMALGANTTGGSNVCIGTSAGDNKTTGSNNIIIGAGSDGLDADETGEIIIGHNLQGVGANYITIGTGTGNDRVYNQFTSNASWTRVSDERYKKEIQDNTDCGLDFINDLRPVTFKWKAKSELDPNFPDYDPEKTTHEHPEKKYGLIAQEVKEALDKNNITDFGGWSCITTGEHTQQGVSQEMFIHPLIKAVQELSAKVEELDKKLSEEN